MDGWLPSPVSLCDKRGRASDLQEEIHAWLACPPTTVTLGFVTGSPERLIIRSRAVGFATLPFSYVCMDDWIEDWHVTTALMLLLKT